MLTTCERMQYQYGIAGVAIERAIGFVGYSQRFKRIARIEKERSVDMKKLSFNRANTHW